MGVLVVITNIVVCLLIMRRAFTKGKTPLLVWTSTLLAISLGFTLHYLLAAK